MRLQGRRALITGGSRGIGRAIAIGFAREGADVGVNYVADAGAAETCCKEIETLGRRAVPLRADIRQKAQVEKMFKEMEERLGPPDILVNNAAVIDWVDFFDISEELWDTIIDTNLKGAFLCTQVAARGMRNRGGGRILNVGSIAGIRATNPLIIPYASSKGGMVMLTRATARALAPYGILVNSMIPATTFTDQNREVLAEPGVRERIVSLTPIGRIANPEDVVGAAIFLVSEDSAYCAGAIVEVAGGYAL